MLPPLARAVPAGAGGADSKEDEARAGFLAESKEDEARGVLAPARWTLSQRLSGGMPSARVSAVAPAEFVEPRSPDFVERARGAALKVTAPLHGAVKAVQNELEFHLADNKDADAVDFTKYRNPMLLRQSLLISSQSRASQTANEKHVSFPLQGRKAFPVFSPLARQRTLWDAVMLLNTCIVMTLTPFELTFVSHGALFGGLFFVNMLINLFFFADMLSCFNTSYFDAEAGLWVMRRSSIAKRYLKSWFLIDAVSILPVEFLFTENAFTRYAKLARILRFFKLLKVLKSPRVIAAISAHWDFNSKLQTLLKYIFALLISVHWSACLLRLLTLLACETNGSRTKETCPKTILTSSFNWNEGIWAVYIEAARWSMVALNGDASALMHSEGVLGMFIMLVGFILLGFLLGELTNTMSNLDPVSNEFKVTRDSLSEFMTKHHFDPQLKARLREYIALSEPVFRDNYYNKIIHELSPRFKHIVTNHVLGYSVTRIPFILYASQSTHGIKEGAIVYVRQLEPEPAMPAPLGWRGRMRRRPRRVSVTAPPPPRRARIIGIPQYLVYDVVYLPDRGGRRPDGCEEREMGVEHSRLDIEETCGTPAIARAIYRLTHERETLVVRISQHFEQQLYMSRDTIVTRDMSTNEHLYLIDSGMVFIFGESSTQPFKCCKKGPLSYFGEDVAMQLVGDGRAPQLVHYSVKTFRVTHLKVISGRILEGIFREPSFALHRRHVKRFGCWLLVKQALIRCVRERTAHRLGPGPVDTQLGEDPAQAWAMAALDAQPSRQGSELTEELAQELELNEAPSPRRLREAPKPPGREAPRPPDEPEAPVARAPAAAVDKALARYFVDRLTATADGKSAANPRVSLLARQLYEALQDKPATAAPTHDA
ncbi:hypothetical protein M885DRAFT_481377 [Pelagophyceae sp. CCMP2097]|nr:hypothetical protein M885DRAFT_481377 [Pelagophyceae sp. CCMP2097]